MRRFTGLSILFFCFLLTGCFVEDLKDQANNSTEKPTEEDGRYFSVSGRLVKGVLQGADIRVYPFVGGQPAAESVAQTATDAQGFYQLRIPREFIGKPALIRASTATAQMKCDLVQGCGGSEFGEWVPLREAGLVLDIGVPELQERGIYNGSVLTHIGFALAQADRPSQGGSENGLADVAVKMAISTANSEVASAFGVVGDLPSIRIFDITSAADRNAAKAAELRYSMINSAIVAAASKVYADNDFVAALNQFSDQFIEIGISGESAIAAVEVDHVDVLDALADSYQYFQQSGDSFTEELSELATMRGLYQNEPAGRYSRGTSSENAHLTFVEKAKRMVESVREIALSINLRKLVEFNNLSGLVSGDVGDALAGFGVVVDASNVIGGEQRDHMLSALGSVGRTVLDALILHYQGKPVPAEINGISISHTLAGKVHSLRIKDDINACEENTTPCNVPVDLVVTVELTSFGGSGTISLLTLKGVEANIAGVMGDSAYRLVFPGIGSHINADELVLQLGGEEFEGQTLVESRNWDMAVPFQILSQDQGQQTSLSAILDSQGETLVLVLNDQETPISVSDAGVEFQASRSFELYELKRFNLSASFAIDAAQNDDFFASINVTQGARPFEGKATYRMTWRKLCGAALGACQDLDEEATIEGETADSFVQLSASVAYKASLKAIKIPVLMQMTGSRESPNTNKISSLKLSYPGHALELNGRFSNNGGIIAIDAMSLDGMHLYFDTISGKRTGAVLTPTQESVAEIIDMGQWVKVRYKDGYFESLL